MGFVKKDKDNTGKMKVNEFKSVLKSIIKNIKDEKETFQQIIDFVKSSEVDSD